MTKRYTVLTTFPVDGCANVGDQLIEVSLKKLVEHELGAVEFLTYFREDPLDAYLDDINATRAVLLPAFAIRDTPLYPNCYRLLKNMEDLRVPLIPIGANWNTYPGDAVTCERITYSDSTRTLLTSIARQHPLMSCREQTLCQVLARHGISNTIMTGDPAWYDPEFFGRPMRRPEEIRSVLFSPPLSPFFAEQAQQVMRMLAELFPAARRICAMHCADARVHESRMLKPSNDAALSPAVTEKNARIRRDAADAGFEVRDVFGDVERLGFYKELDLHVGYECHAHVSFFRWRIPSILIAEDARGVGFNETFGVGGFNAFRRCQDDLPYTGRKGGTSGYCVSLDEYATAPADHRLTDHLRQFLHKETDNRFVSYVGIASLIDETYQRKMAPFLRSLP